MYLGGDTTHIDTLAAANLQVIASLLCHNSGEKIQF